MNTADPITIGQILVILALRMYQKSIRSDQNPANQVRNTTESVRRTQISFDTYVEVNAYMNLKF